MVSAFIASVFTWAENVIAKDIYLPTFGGAFSVTLHLFLFLKKEHSYVQKTESKLYALGILGGVMRKHIALLLTRLLCIIPSKSIFAPILRITRFFRHFVARLWLIDWPSLNSFSYKMKVRIMIEYTHTVMYFSR